MRNATKISALALAVALSLSGCGSSGPDAIPGSDADLAATSPLPASPTAAAQPGTVPGVSGHLVSKLGNQSEDRWTFFLAHDGSYRFESAAGFPGEVYDARTGAVEPTDPSGTNLDAPVRIEVAPGVPDRWPFSLGILDRALGWAVRALAEEGDPAVTETTWKGRRAWRYRYSPKGTDAGGLPQFDRVEVVVDVETALPLERAGFRDGRRRSIVTIEGLNTKASLPPEMLEAAKPGGVSEGFKRMALEEAAQVSGFVPCVPTALPSGYGLTEVAVSTASGPGEGETNLLWRGPIVSLAYRRGVDEIVVTSRATGLDPKAWEDVDPLAGEGTAPAQVLPLHAGPLSKAVIDPQVVPHGWGLMDGLMVTVAGAVSAGELSNIGASFRCDS